MRSFGGLLSKTIRQKHVLELLENSCDMFKPWRQEKGTAATNHAFCDALQLGLVQCQDLAEKFH